MIGVQGYSVERGVIFKFSWLASVLLVQVDTVQRCTLVQGWTTEFRAADGSIPNQPLVGLSEARCHVTSQEKAYYPPLVIFRGQLLDPYDPRIAYKSQRYFQSLKNQSEHSF